MRPTITATILAIAASLAAGDNDRLLFSKVSKVYSDGCSCSDSTLERAQMLKNLAFDMYAPEGTITALTLYDFCDDPDRFMTAANDIAGCLIYPTCLVGQLMTVLTDDVGDNQLNEGDFFALAIESMCEGDRSGETQPAGGCGDVTIETLCSQLPPAPARS
jgi:hypothetical protein